MEVTEDMCLYDSGGHEGHMFSPSYTDSGHCWSLTPLPDGVIGTRQWVTALLTGLGVTAELITLISLETEASECFATYSNNLLFSFLCDFCNGCR